jgi:hypothetical protein
VPARTEEEQPPTEGEPKPQSAAPPVAQPVAPPPEQVPPDEAAVTAASTVYAHYLIKRHFADETFWSRKFRGRNSDKLVRLRHVIVSLLDACRVALAELDDPTLPGHREGNCWRGWVRDLMQIAKQHKLPTGTRTDTTDGPSPFVELVRELQQYVLPEAQRHTHSYEALAKALQRARRPEA